MALSFVTYPGQTGAATDFVVPFGFLSRDHVTADVDGVNAPFTWLNDGLIRMDTAPVGDLVISRSTPNTSPQVSFVDGSTHSAEKHNTQNLQLLYVAQEALDETESALKGDGSTADALNQRIKNVASPVNPNDAATKAYADANIDATNAAKDAAVAAKVAAEAAETGAVAAEDGAIAAQAAAELAEANAEAAAATFDPSNYATAAQGVTADSALQPGDVGSAAFNDTGDFATAAQGAKADTALQKAWETVAVFYDAGADGPVAVAESPDLVDGYRYRVVFDRTSHDGANNQIQLEMRLDDGSTRGAVIISTNANGSTNVWNGEVEFPDARLSQPQHTAWHKVRSIPKTYNSSVNGSGAEDVTLFGWGATSGKIKNIRITTNATNLNEGRVILQRIKQEAL